MGCYTGPLNKDKTLLYRFTGSYQNNNSFRDFISDVGIPVIGKRPAPIPINRSLGDPNMPTSNLNQVRLGSLLNHRFNEDWAIHSRFLASFDHGDTTFVNPAPAFDLASALNPITGIMQRNAYSQENEGEEHATNLDLTGRFNLGFSKHEVFLGFDFYRAFQNYGTKDFWVTPNPALAINIYDPAPSYGIPEAVFDNTLMFSQRPGNDHSVFFTQWEGVYFQDQITLWDKLHIMGADVTTGRKRPGEEEPATHRLVHSWIALQEMMMASVRG